MLRRPPRPQQFALVFERAIAELAKTWGWRQSIDKAQAQRLFCRYVAEDPAFVIEVTRARGLEETSLESKTIVHRLKVRPKRTVLATPPVEELKSVEY